MTSAAVQRGVRPRCPAGGVHPSRGPDRSRRRAGRFRVARRRAHKGRGGGVGSRSVFGAAPVGDPPPRPPRRRPARASPWRALQPAPRRRPAWYTAAAADYPRSVVPPRVISLRRALPPSPSSRSLPPLLPPQRRRARLVRRRGGGASRRRRRARWVRGSGRRVFFPAAQAPGGGPARRGGAGRGGRARGPGRPPDARPRPPLLPPRPAGGPSDESGLQSSRGSTNLNSRKND